MAQTLSSNISAELRWSRVDALDLSSITDSNRLSSSLAFLDGTGSNQADRVFHDTRTVGTEANDDLDLRALVQSIYGSNVTITFAEVVGILIVNKHATLPLVVGAAASNAWDAPFDDADNTIEVPALSPLLMVNRVAGWATASDNKVLRIANASSAEAVTYDIAIIGRSA